MLSSSQINCKYVIYEINLFQFFFPNLLILFMRLTNVQISNLYPGHGTNVVGVPVVSPV